MSSNRSTPEHGNDAAATPSDAAPDATPSSSKASMRKDRICPFCRQAFTSSSLGRHLDSFIRDKSPKPHDGLHDVNKIHKLRENITRRHTRVPAGAVVDNSSRRWSITSIVSPKAGPKNAQPLGYKPSVAAEASLRTSFEPPIAKPAQNWMVTGVINDLPPRANPSPLPRILPRPEANMNPPAQGFANLDDIDDARAVEQALREVLHVVRTAAATVDKPALFDFDFYSCNFPALCVRLLQAPAALFSSTPLPSPRTWPLCLPSQAHLTALQDGLRDKIVIYQDRQEQGTSNITADPASRHQSHANVFYHAEFKGLFDHLELAYQHWQARSESQKHEIWHLETLRAYAQEVEKGQNMQAYISRLQEEADALRAQMEDYRTNKPTWQEGRVPPSSIARTLPVSLPKNIITAITKSGVNVSEWDYDRLISRYRPNIERARKQSAGGPNDLRTAHERVLGNFGLGAGAQDSVLLRPIIAAAREGQGLSGDTPRSGMVASDREAEGDEESHDDDGDGEGEFEADGDVDMDDGEAEDGGRRGLS